MPTLTVFHLPPCTPPPHPGKDGGVKLYITSCGVICTLSTLCFTGTTYFLNDWLSKQKSNLAFNAQSWHGLNIYFEPAERFHSCIFELLMGIPLNVDLLSPFSKIRWYKGTFCQRASSIIYKMFNNYLQRLKLILSNICGSHLINYVLRVWLVLDVFHFLR